jgi:hypothetical protein
MFQQASFFLEEYADRRSLERFTPIKNKGTMRQNTRAATVVGIALILLVFFLQGFFSFAPTPQHLMKPFISPPAILISSPAISAWTPNIRRLLRNFKRFRFSSDMGYLSITTRDTGKNEATFA